MAAPTSNNEVTARRLSRLLVGADGNGGLWKKVNDKVSGAIGALDVSSVGGAGKYISAISETDGKISATATTMDTSPTASSTNAVTSGGIKTALDNKVSYNGFVLEGNAFGSKRLFINYICNGMYSMDKRYYVTATMHDKTVSGVSYPRVKSGAAVTDSVYYEDSPVVSTVDEALLRRIFAGNYETQIPIPAGKYLKVHIQFSNESNWTPATGATFPSSPYGTYLLSFYYTFVPESAQWRCYNTYTSHTVGWKNGNFGYLSGNASSTLNVVLSATDSGNYQRTCIEILVFAKDDAEAELSQIDWQLERQGSMVNTPLFTNYANNYSYFDLLFRTKFGSANTISLVADTGTVTANQFVGPLSGNATTATTATNYNTSTGTIKTALDGKVDFQLLNNTALIGNGAPAADCKAYWVSANMPDNHITAVYNRPGNEVTLLFSKRGNFGSILKYGYADKYLYMLRFQNSTWKSDDWEKINAGYADSAGTASNYTSSGTISTALASKQSKVDCSAYCTDTSGWLKVASVPAQITSSNINAIFDVMVHSNASPSYGMLYMNVRLNGTGVLPGVTTFIWVKHSQSTLNISDAKVRTVGTGKDVTVELWIKPGTYSAVTLSLNKNMSDLYQRDFVWTFYSGNANASEPTADAANNIQVASLTKQSSTDASWISSGSFGNITTSGALQTTDVTIANGDKLVVTDSSDSAKVARASLAFDGSSYGQLLSKKGTWEYPYEAFLNWGGTNKTGSYGPLDAALVDVLGANRFSFLKPAGITVEYTRDGGTTWTDYGLSDGGKIELFTSTSGNVSPTIGKSDSEHKATADENWANYKLRVTLTAPAIGLYTGIRKIPILVSTSGTAGAKVTARAITRTNEESGGAWTNMGSMSLSGWSGWNILNLSSTYTPWSGSAGQKSQHSKFEMLFEATQATPAASQQYLGLCIIRIFGYGASPAWNKPSVLADTGHLYSFDNAKNATFPAQVTATSFNGRLIRELDSSAAINALEIVNVSSGSDGFAIKYARNSSGVNTTTFQSRVSDNDVLSFGNLVGSEYKQAINITNGSAAITGSLTGTASTAKAYDTSFTGTNSIKLALDGKQNTLTVMTDTEVSDLLGAMA